MTTNQTNNKTDKDKVNAFFQSENWRKFLTFSFFVLIAFGFWTLQYLQQRFEIEVTVPIEYLHIPAEISLNDSLPGEVKIKVSDKGTALLSYKYLKRVEPVKINLHDIKQADNIFRVPRTSFEKEIYKSLLSTTNVLSYTPDNLVIGYNPLQKKLLPVVLNGSIIPVAGYMFTDSVHIEPSEVWVYGSVKELEKLHSVSTESIEKKDLDKELQLNLNLEIPPKVRMDVKQVFLSAVIEEYTEKTVTVPVTCKNTPETHIVRLFPSTVEIICQIALSKYSTITNNDFEVSIEYEELLKNKQMIVPVSLTKKPDWLKSYRILPEKVEFLIEKKPHND